MYWIYVFVAWTYFMHGLPEAALTARRFRETEHDKWGAVVVWVALLLSAVLWPAVLCMAIWEKLDA